ncbi:MAG: hypothetical protein IJS34_01695 [Alphaproteobacteria bacterium]|nr:hypothetical protein [Alphaproteobacteria bacterium]
MKKFLFGILGLLFAVPAVADCQSVNLISSTAPRTWQENTLTITSNGQGTYTLNGTLTANNAYTLANINTFTIPESVANGGTGSLYLGNTKQLYACKIYLQYNTNVIDTWALSTINRATTSYSSMARKQINNIAIQCTSDTTVDNLSLSPAIYNDSRTSFDEFVPGCPNYDNSCRNLFDISQIATEEFVTTNSIWTRYNIDVSSVGLSVGTWSSKHTNFISPGTYTITVNGIDNITIRGYDGSNISVLRRGNGTFTITKPTQIWIFTASPEVIAGITEIMLEQGDTATAYVPYCAPDIKIATTAYNSARFSPVVTELNNTIATIRSVVTNTINQTAAIADLQATKQTRPDENCPAGKKCLLVEDNDGTPHWFEIVESAD